jgi:phytoene dehydrogenase-like protein
MAAQFRKVGGEIRTATPVRKIRVVNGRATGVVYGRDGGEEVAADRVICCIDLNKALRDLVGPEPEYGTHLSPACRRGG